MIRHILIELDLPDEAENIDEATDDFVKYVHDTLWVDEQENMPLSIPEETKFSVRAVQVAPNHFPKGRRWKPGERVCIPGHSGSYPDSSRNQYGTVVGVEDYLAEHDRLILHLDGEPDPRPINEDVVRHLREGEK